MSRNHTRPIWGSVVYIYVTCFLLLTFGCEQCFTTINDADEQH